MKLMKLKIAALVFINGFKCLCYTTKKAYVKANSNKILQVDISLQVVHKHANYEARNLTTRIQTIKDHKDIKYS